jgi:hypothetical protein
LTDRPKRTPPDLDVFARRYAEAWCSQDPGSVASFYAEDGVLSVNDGPPAVGRAAITEVAVGFMTAFPDMIVTFDRLTPGAQGIEFHWTLSGTNTGPDGTGKRVRISGYEEWQMSEGGLVAASKGHYDSAEYDRQLEFGVDG